MKGRGEGKLKKQEGQFFDQMHGGVSTSITSQSVAEWAAHLPLAGHWQWCITLSPSCVSLSLSILFPILQWRSFFYSNTTRPAGGIGGEKRRLTSGLEFISSRFKPIQLRRIHHNPFVEENPLDYPPFPSIVHPIPNLWAYTIHFGTNCWPFCSLNTSCNLIPWNWRGSAWKFFPIAYWITWGDQSINFNGKLEHWEAHGKSRRERERESVTIRAPGVEVAFSLLWPSSIWVGGRESRDHWLQYSFSKGNYTLSASTITRNVGVGKALLA